NYWISQNATDRKTIKGVTVPYLYGQGELKAQGVLLKILAKRKENWIADDYDDDGEVKRRPPKAKDIPHRSWFVKKHRAAIAGVFPGIGPIKDFLRDCATMLALCGEVLRWTSPSGVTVCNRYNESNPHERTYYLGAKRVRHIGAYSFRPELDATRCASG